MKKAIKSLLVVGIFLLFPLFVLTQNPPHPNGGGGPGGGNTPVGGGAPVGEGIILLVTMGMLFGIKKWKAIKDSDQ